MTAQRGLARTIGALRPWQLSALCIALAEIITSGMSLLLRGYIAPDYLITGFVAALFVSYSVLQLLSVSRSELEERVKERTRTLQVWDTAMTESVTAFAISDLEGKVTFVNRALLNLWGYENEQEVLGRTLFRFWRDHEKVQAGLDALMQRGTWSGELVAVRRDGSVRDMHLTTNLLSDADGRPVSIMGSFLDVTERNRMIEKLRRNEAQLHEILDSIFGFIGIFSLDGKGLYYNRVAAEATGVPLEEALGRSFWDTYWWSYSPEVQADLRQAMQRAAQGEVVHWTQSARIRPEGMIVAEATFGPLRDETGAISRIIGFGVDITERKRAEDQLRKLSLAVEQSSNFIVITNTEGTIEYVNPKFSEVTGYSAEEAIGRTAALFSSRLTEKTKNEPCWDTLMAGGAWHGEFLNRKKNGEPFWCEEHIAPIHDSSGKITHFVAIEIDITERRKTAEQLQQAQKMETAGHLAGGVAHDFNNLLTVIQGNLELLRERTAGQSEASRLADRALHAAGRSAELVSQLLLFSRRQFLKPQAVDVGALIGRTRDLLRSMMMETISVTISVPDNLWHAFADPAQLENALLNLALNARDAMPQGGTLSIAAENVELVSDLMLAVSGVAPGSFVHIRVADTGTGMSPEILQRAFEPFFTTKEVGKGSGLGLSMVYGFIKQSGGHIEIDSAPGRGTSVDLYLKKTEPERVAEASIGEVHARAGGETILVVEDNSEVREIAVRFLQELGYRVIEAPDGPAALAILESIQGIDLLFTDIVMPGAMSGVELARRATNLRPGIRHLFVTGYAEEIAPGGSAEVMGGEILTKPYRKDDLGRAVRDALKAPAGH